VDVINGTSGHIETDHSRIRKLMSKLALIAEYDTMVGFVSNCSFPCSEKGKDFHMVFYGVCSRR